MKIAVLDDYAGKSATFADWSRVKAKASVEVFENPLVVPDEAARVLAPFEVICLIRERMPVPRALIEKLPNLKMIVTTGGQSHTLDAKAATEHELGKVERCGELRHHLCSPAEAGGVEHVAADVAVHTFEMHRR